MLNLLLQSGMLDYNCLKLYGKSFHQPVYRILQAGLKAGWSKKDILDIFNNKSSILNNGHSYKDVISMIKDNVQEDNKESIQADFYTDNEGIPEPCSLDMEHKNLMIFDDVMLEGQKMPEKYYTKGRHSNTDCFYLSQNYIKLPRHTIRENANFIILFPQSCIDINNIYRDHCSSDLTKDQFRAFLKACWAKKHSFAVIDLTSELNNGRYRCGLDSFLMIPEIKS